MKSPDTIEQVYSDVIEAFSQQRQSEMKSLIALLTRSTDADSVSPDKHLTPIENGDNYLSPFAIAKFGNMRRFTQEFTGFVTEVLAFYVTEAKESDQISNDQAVVLIDALTAWNRYMRPSMEALGKCAESANIEFAKFCTHARISDLFQRPDVLFKDELFDSECVRGTLVAIELDIQVLTRLIKSPITNDMFGGDVVVNRKGVDHKIETPSIADLL